MTKSKPPMSKSGKSLPKKSEPTNKVKVRQVKVNLKNISMKPLSQRMTSFVEGAIDTAQQNATMHYVDGETVDGESLVIVRELCKRWRNRIPNMRVPSIMRKTAGERYVEELQTLEQNLDKAVEYEQRQLEKRQRAGKSAKHKTP